MRGVIFIVSDGKVKDAALLVSEELGLPIVTSVGNGVLPILNPESGKAIIESLVRSIDEDLFIVLIIGKGTWSIIEKTVSQIDIARLLMRLELRSVG
ncbi:hypothetical protein [Caldivirga maquilingensis]|uniref:Uncharacterized protein n=1 Tax=Caldivirga maquilingensis (strain ATCC 700844 / DSM 13496 / JCM 10307 / IC-167) TaxID=397948 RepID=A8MCK9_CALMQ|nr:hypothetical protein [Caldivirga maquilingensis]ABW01515.1 hypothetical protein Cmaq_0675 [Caldivirga maquilingensis IC-167]